MKVPFFDLSRQHKLIGDEIAAAINSTIQKSSFILGDSLSVFENNFSQYLKSEHCIGVGSGTEALHIAFRGLELKTEDEVLLPAHTFAATAIAVILAGARPVLVDVDPKSYLMDFQKAKELVSPRTKAICPVHLYGRVCDMDEISLMADKYNLHVVEDAAQSHGAKWKNKFSGTFGAFGCFSFYPSKNLGAIGDGGALVTNSDVLAERVRKIRNYGSEVKYSHPIFGFNSRLDSVQAAVLNVKLKYLDNWNEKRRSAAAKYVKAFKKAGLQELILPELLSENEHVFHLFVIRVPNRSKLQERLNLLGIGTGMHYPNPFYLEKGFSNLGYKKGDFPNTELLSESILSLPLFPEITEEEISYVVKCLIENL